MWFIRDDYKVLVGKTNKNMVRKLPYIVVEFPKINKTIIVNNLYWEATFLCDNIFWNREYLKLSKEDLLKQYAETVTRVDYFDETSWSNQIKLRLSQWKGCINDNDAWKDQENSQEKWLSYKNKISGLTDEEELALLKSYKEWNDIAARDKIFYLYRDRSKIWLQKILRKYEDEYDLAETDIDDLYQDDLYQESDLILLNAIEDFVENFEENVNNEKKFTNYLRMYYFSKMQQYLDDKFELVSTDFSMHEELELDKNINDLWFQLKTLSSKKQNEVIEEEENSQKREDDIEETGVDDGKTEVDEEEIEECCEEKWQPILVEIWNLFKDTSIDSDLDRQHTLASLKIELNRAIGTLSQREQDVLRLYFWLDWNYPKTLEEIWEMLDITMERVRQIKERALKRLKHMNRSNVLRKYQKD